MSLLKIVRLGHPALRKISKKVTLQSLRTKSFQIFLDNLSETCIKSNGAGIAAPQVNVNKRVIVVYVDPKNPRYPNRNPFPLTIVINPKVIAKSKGSKEDWEGDLSVNLRGLVPRSESCTVSGIDRDGKPVTYVLNDPFHARVFQHEIDHLDGKFFIDKVKRIETLSEYKEWKKYWKDNKTLSTKRS